MHGRAKLISSSCLTKRRTQVLNLSDVMERQILISLSCFFADVVDVADVVDADVDDEDDVILVC